MEKGSVQIYYGAGRGKTNAALGNALRAAGENKSVIIIQFLKGKTDDQIAYMKQLEPESRYSVLKNQKRIMMNCRKKDRQKRNSI